MPRVNLGRDPVKESQTATRRIIMRGMVEQGYEKQVDIAKRLGMCQSKFSMRLASGDWRRDELVGLARVLKLTPEDAAKMLGIK